MNAQTPQGVLLTGGGGFIGGAVTRALLAAGYRVWSLGGSSSSGGPQPRLVNPVGPAAFFDPPADTHWVAAIHLAVRYQRPGIPPADILESNLLLPARLMNLCAARGIPAFLHGDSFFTRNGRLYPPLTLYSLSKVQALTWLKTQAEVHAQTQSRPPRLFNLRIEHPYGPGDRPWKFIPWLLETLVGPQAQDHLALTDGSQIRDFIAVDDVARAFMTVLTEGHRLPPGADGVTELEVGTGQGTPLGQMVETLAHHLGSKTRLDFGALPHRPGEITASVADSAALASLGWQARVDLDQGLAQLAADRLARLAPPVPLGDHP